MEDIIEFFDMTGHVALFVPPGTLLFFEIDLKSTDLNPTAYRFQFDDVVDSEAIWNRPQIWTKTLVDQKAMWKEIEETLTSGGGVDVCEIMSGELTGDEARDRFFTLCKEALPPKVSAAQLMQHRGWHGRNMLKLQLVFHESHGSVMPEPVRVSQLPDTTPIEHLLL